MTKRGSKSAYLCCRITRKVVLIGVEEFIVGMKGLAIYVGEYDCY